MNFQKTRQKSSYFRRRLGGAHFRPLLSAFAVSLLMSVGKCIYAGTRTGRENYFGVKSLAQLFRRFLLSANQLILTESTRYIFLISQLRLVNSWSVFKKVKTNHSTQTSQVKQKLNLWRRTENIQLKIISLKEIF